MEYKSGAMPEINPARPVINSARGNWTMIKRKKVVYCLLVPIDTRAS